MLTIPRREWISRTAVVALAASVLAACASHPKPPVTPTPPPPPPPAQPPYQPPPEAPPPPMQTGILPGTEQDFVVNVGDRVYFDYNAIALKPEAETILAAQAGWLQRYPAVMVRIEGNCDERGTEEYNLALGSRRATAVKDFLVNHGVSLSRITTVSYGKEHPIDTGTGDAAWAKNRNAHTAILSGAR
jgi:peptidoglycan-associated lipoprotein